MEKYQSYTVYVYTDGRDTTKPEICTTEEIEEKTNAASIATGDNWGLKPLFEFNLCGEISNQWRKLTILDK